VDGGAGNDRVTYYSSAGPLNINLETGVADDGSGTPDSPDQHVERISGNNGFADVIIGRADSNETLYGNGGDDTLDGGVGGSDTTGYSFTHRIGRPGQPGAWAPAAASTASTC
jgi:Ca2+-binding RTX toxin-like protein